MLPAYSSVQILGKDTGSNWYQILYAAAPDGVGWVTAQYIQVPDAKAIPTLARESGSTAGPSGFVTQQVNVRSGPGTSYDSLGTLNQHDTVMLTGKNPEGTWLQINFSPAPDGFGWIAAGFVDTGQKGNLPIIGEKGQIVGTGTPSAIPAAVIATVSPAREDGDSPSNPSASSRFSPDGISLLQFSSDLSAPQGDSEDWIAFIPYTNLTSIGLECLGGLEINAILWQDNAPLNEAPLIGCGSQKMLELVPGVKYLLRVHAPGVVPTLQYTRFTLNISTMR